MKKRRDKDDIVIIESQNPTMSTERPVSSYEETDTVETTEATKATETETMDNTEVTEAKEVPEMKPEDILNILVIGLPDHEYEDTRLPDTMTLLTVKKFFDAQEKNTNSTRKIAARIVSFRCF